MKLKTLTTTSLLALYALLAGACIKAELPNSECDIEKAYIHLSAPEEVFFSKSDTLVNVLSDAKQIVFKVREEADLTRLAPIFQITKGATISPKSGSEHDFSEGGVKYTLTSEDGEWKRTYTVEFKKGSSSSEEDVYYDFENCFLDKTYHKYYVWSDILEDGTNANNWQTANPGFWLINSDAPADSYPTTVLTHGQKGKGVKLITRSTGSFGETFNRRIAAGNLYTGKFNINEILNHTLKATEMGLPFNKKPLRFQGYYTYKRGEKFQDETGKILDNVQDIGSLYAVFYKNHDEKGNSIVLYGDDCQTSPQIVALARVKDLDECENWTYFDVEFDYDTYGKGVDNEQIKENGYNLSVVCSASKEGELFRAAVGSVLCVDSFKIVCEKTE